MVRPVGAVVSPDGQQLYVSTGRGGTLMRWIPRRLAARVGSRRRTTVGARPQSDGTRLYTANGPSNDVSVVDAATLTLITKIPVGQSPWGAAIVERSRYRAPVRTGANLWIRLPIVDFADVDVAERIDPDGVREGHLAGQPAASAKVPERLAALALDGPDDVVVRVGHEEILLLRVLGDHHLVDRAADGLGERDDDLPLGGVDPPFRPPHPPRCAGEFGDT